MFAALCTLTAGCADDFKTVLNDKYYEDDTPSREPDITEQTLTLGSYNLWISSKGTGDYLWTNRRTVLAAVDRQKQMGHLRLPRSQRNDPERAADARRAAGRQIRMVVRRPRLGRTASAAKRWASPTTPIVSS